MSDAQFTGIIQVDVLEQWFAVFDPLVNETRILIDEDGWHGAMVDPANVAMIRQCDLAPRAFESYDTPGTVRVGVNIERFLDALGPAASDDLVQISLDMETMHFEVEYRTVEQSIALIDPDAIRNEPDTPDLDLPNRVATTGDYLDEAVTVADLVGDHLFVQCDPDADPPIRLYSQGDTDDAGVRWSHDETGDGTELTAATESLFSLEYMKELVDPIPGDATVTLTCGDEFPIIMDWTAAAGDLSVRQMCAPRIQSD